MAEKEYIEREAVRNALYEADAITMGGVKILNQCPTADVVEVRHGAWRFHRDGSGTCNQCGGTAKNVWDYDSWQHYCGRCGAKMDGKGEGE